MDKLRVLTCFLFVFYCLNAFAQPEFSPKTWLFIDSSIRNKKSLADIDVLVQRLRQKASDEKKYLNEARCYLYLMNIADLRSEDSLYFKNSVFIDSLLAGPALPGLLELSMHVLQAKRLNQFTRGRKFQRERYERKDIPFNYAAYTDHQLDSIAQLHFEEARELAKKYTDIPIEEALWLSSDPWQFLYKPDLYDIVIGEQLWQYNMKNPYRGIGLADGSRWLSLDPEEFTAGLDSFLSPGHIGYSDLRLYKEWIDYHENDPVTKKFIESVARKFLYTTIKLYDNDKAEKIYETYLKKIAASPYSIVRAHAVYQLCLLWNSQSSLYYPLGNNNYSFSDARPADYDTVYRYHALKALKLFDENRALMDSFHYLKRILLEMERAIKRSEVILSLEQNNLPGESLLAELKFKNADSLYYRIIRLNGKESYDPSATRRSSLIASLLNLSVFAERKIDLPSTNDYNQHFLYLKIDPLPPGNYVILFSYKPAIDTSFLTHYAFFNVTNIAVLNNDNRVYVLHRKTGMPLQGAEVIASYNSQQEKEHPVHKVASEKLIVNSKGYVLIKHDGYTKLEVHYRGDTTFNNLSVVSNSSEDVYNKAEYNDLVEYYEENATAYIFTDRSIYRPGQTVYFKVIFITKNRKTGEPMVMSRQNMKGKLFGNIYKRWFKESEPLLYISDPFRKNMDSLKIIPNEYGSVSGSFKIPMNAATGEWDIEPDYIDVETRSSSFRVEEYKRPSYEIVIGKPKMELLPGDEFRFKVKIRSFAGASLQNVQVNYSVSRNVSRYNTRDSVVSTDEANLHMLMDTTGYTNEQGMLEIKVRDKWAGKFNREKTRLDFNYEINVTAVDATDENYTEDASILISTRPVLLKTTLNNVIDRNKLYPISISAKDRNAGSVEKNVIVSIYRKQNRQGLYKARQLYKADMWLYDKEELQRSFPYLDILMDQKKETRELVFRDTIRTDEKEKLVLDPQWLTVGNYEAEFTAIEDKRTLGEMKQEFSVFDEAQNELPQATFSFSHLPLNQGLPGDSLQYFYGNTEQDIYSIIHIAYYSRKNKASFKSSYDERLQPKGVGHYMLRIPAAAIGQLKLTVIYVFNNQVFTREQRINIVGALRDEPEIIVEKYRKNLQPGSKETFSVSVKTKNENIVAELMTTMYDASLDKLGKHEWRQPVSRGYGRYINTGWQSFINSTINSDNYWFDQRLLPGQLESPVLKPVWWYTGEDANEIAHWAFASASMMRSSPFESLMGRLPGLSISNAEGLNDVVVIGYGSTRRLEMTGAVSAIRIRGNLSGYVGNERLLIMLDGIPYEGDPSGIDMNTIVQGLILKGADATALYGSRAANGVIILSSTGDIVLPQEPAPVIVPRKNFSESAFFFPAIHADKSGFYSFSFTMPETVTEWNWKMLAHTKNAAFALAEKKLNTSLPLMVQPNMPRLLYQGDRIVLQSRISNMDNLDISGQIICKIEDEVTGEDITSKIVSVPKSDFSLRGKSNSTFPFEINVPAQQLNPLKIIITARSQKFADGEEHIIPIASPKIFVRDNRSFEIVNNKDTTLPLTQLPADASLYGIGLSIQTRPQAALINSLPYLANYPYGCAEQTFNKLLANITALHIMRSDSEASKTFSKVSRTVELETGKSRLPDELAEQTMPWLNISHKTVLQQRQLFNLLDTSRSTPAIEAWLTRLYKLQNKDGGLTWFDGGKSNFYISCYILQGFGLLKKEQQLIPERFFNNTYQSFITNLIQYCDGVFASQDVSVRNSKSDLLFYFYARSYWVDQYALRDSAMKMIEKTLLEKWTRMNGNSLYDQALLIIASLRFGEKDSELFTKAAGQLNSISQLAINDESNGLRWKSLADANNLNNTAEETIVLLAEAFKSAGRDISDGILKWLLTTRSEYNWSSTKATAAVIGLLKQKNKMLTGNSQIMTLGLDDSVISVTDDLLKGYSFSFVQSNSLPATLRISKEKDLPAKGSLGLYYFSAGELAKLNKDIQLEKRFYKWNIKNRQWELLEDNTVVKVADKVKVILTIHSSGNLSYVYIDDKRAAAFEPFSSQSGYEYAEGFGYYRSIRDGGTQFFADFIPSGKHEISYELKVSQEGSFTSGSSVLQCMYKPELTAYTNASKVSSAK